MDKDQLKTSQPVSLHVSRRKRLRERFLKGGKDSLQDNELLEVLLSVAMPQRDVKPIAKKLLKSFGSLNAIISAPSETLSQIDSISENSVAAIKSVFAISERTTKQELMEKPLLSNWKQLIVYCHMSMDFETKEHFRVLFLNKKNRLLDDEIQFSGTVDHTPAYPREIVKRALEIGATAMILVHNHPSGDPKPSPMDIEMTKMIVDAASPLNIAIHDHIIISRGNHFSFKKEGLLGKQRTMK